MEEKQKNNKELISQIAVLTGVVHALNDTTMDKEREIVVKKIVELVAKI